MAGLRNKLISQGQVIKEDNVLLVVSCLTQCVLGFLTPPEAPPSSTDSLLQRKTTALAYVGAASSGGARTPAQPCPHQYGGPFRASWNHEQCGHFQGRPGIMQTLRFPACPARHSVHSHIQGTILLQVFSVSVSTGISGKYNKSPGVLETSPESLFLLGSK